MVEMTLLASMLRCTRPFKERQAKRMKIKAGLETAGGRKPCFGRRGAVADEKEKQGIASCSLPEILCR